MTDDKVSVTAAPSQEGSSALASAVEDQMRLEKARKFRKGDRVKGRVQRLTESMAFVELPGKAEGLLDLAELRRPDGSLDLEEGQLVEGLVVEVAANGILLKRSLVTEDESVQQLKAAKEAGLPVQARVVAVKKGGLDLELFGLRGFCPASQVELKKVDDLTGYVGRTFTFRLQDVVEHGEHGPKIVLSRRALLAEEHDQLVAQAKAKIQPGAVLQGKVARVQAFGAFVDLGMGIEGLCHVSELTRARIHDATKVVEAGQELQVQVLEIKEATDKHGKTVEHIALTHKAFEADPWEGAAERFKAGEKVSGTVVRLAEFGAFIEVQPGVDGLAHISTLSAQRIGHPSEAVKTGDRVEAWILAVEPEKKRLSLSLIEPKKPEARPERPKGRPARPERSERPRRERAAAATPAAPVEVATEAAVPGAPDEAAPAKEPAAVPEGESAARPERPHYKAGQVHEGTVEKVEPFGVFVSLPGGGRALVPNRELGVVKNADQKIDYRKIFPAGSAIRIALTEVGGRGLKGSVLEAQKADERAMVKEWSRSQKQEGGGKQGFGTFGDLLRKANLVK